MIRSSCIILVFTFLFVLGQCNVNETTETPDDDLCPICYENMNNHEKQVKLTCNHELCLYCWVNCFMQDFEKCPICRNPNLQNFLSNFTHSFLIMKILHNKTFSNTQLSHAFQKFVTFGNLGICQFLLQNYKINVNSKNDFGYSAIHSLILSPKLSSGKKFEFFKYLIRNANVNIYRQTDRKGENILHHAAFMNHIDLVIFLIEHENFIVNQFDSFDNNVLIHALNSKNADEKQILKLIQLLVEKYGANFYAENHAAISPIFLSINLGYFTIFDYFEQKMNFGTKQSYFYKKRFLHRILMDSELSELQKLNSLQFLIFHTKLNTQVVTSKGLNLLHMAIRSGHQQIMKYLSEYIDSNLVDFDGNSPIYFVLTNNESESEKIEMLKFLIEEKNANVNHKNLMDETIFQASLFYLLPNVTKYLLKNTNLNATDVLFEILLTPFLATEEDKIQYFQYFFEKQPNIDLGSIKNKRGATVLHLSANLGFVKIMDYFLENRHLSLVNTKDVKGNSALFYVIASSHLDKDRKWEILNYFISKIKVNWNLVHDENGANLLHASLFHSQFWITDCLLAKTNLDINAPDIFGDTPLASLLYSPTDPIVKSLSLKYYVTKNGGKVTLLTQNEKLIQFLAYRDHHKILSYLWDQEKEEKELNKEIFL